MEKKSWFTRVLIILFIVFLGVLVFMSFLLGEPIYTIGSGIIIILLIITVLILSEAFDNFSIGKLLSITRETQRKDDEIKNVKAENEHLRDNLIQITSMISQISNQNTTNNNLLFTPENIGKMLGVVKADEDNKEKENDDNTFDTCLNKKPEDFCSNSETVNVQPEKKRIAFSDYRKLEDLALNRFLKKADIPEMELMKEVQFAQTFTGIDPIMERKIIFDGYLKTPLKEYFIDVVRDIHFSNYYRIYVMISKIMYYRQFKNIQAELTLIIIHIPETFLDSTVRGNNLERFIEAFQPAIANGLLRIENVYFDETEINNIIDI